MSKNLKSVGMILGGLVIIGAIGFVGIQFVPVDKSNPPVVSEPKWDSPQTKALVERACFDCHSNQTKWPWYSNIAPVSWMLAHNVHEGRSKLNFSELGATKGQINREQGGEEGEGGERGERGEGIEMNELVRSIEKGSMPPRDYVTLHPEARLTDAEVKSLIAGLKATFGSGGEGAMAQ